MAAFHNRMPVILASETFDEWLAGTVEQTAGLLRWYVAEELEAYPISRWVDNPRNKRAELLGAAED
jgi:putative SOS response-associated peptidase YedK